MTNSRRHNTSGQQTRSWYKSTEKTTDYQLTTRHVCLHTKNIKQVVNSASTRVLSNSQRVLQNSQDSFQIPKLINNNEN